MEVLVSVENFQEGACKFREINSPRSLEACLRAGLDPSELYPQTRKNFTRSALSSPEAAKQSMTKEMVEIKFEAFERKRHEKIATVKKERNAIINFSDRRTASPGSRSPARLPQFTAEQIRQSQADKAAAILEMEEKRIEALRRRQEKELSKIVEREQTMAALQLKLKRAEEEEIRRKRLHEKKVHEEKLAEEKKRMAREHELKKLEQDEFERRRQLAKKDAEIEEKLKKKRVKLEAEMKREARRRDEERNAKIEEARLKTEALLKAQEEIAEQNRQNMLEREQRILAQLEEKKLQKRDELTVQREKAAKRIAEAIEKHHLMHMKKKQDYDQRQGEAKQRASESLAAYERRLKTQAEAREKRNKLRLQRLVDAFRRRADYRSELVEKREQRDEQFTHVKESQEERVTMSKFLTSLKMEDRLENVERVARMQEFRRLQTLQKIYSEDNKLEEIQQRRDEMLRRHNEEAKMSLVRKHEIADTMEKMRMTNDFTLLDKLFTSKKSRKDKVKSGKQEEAEAEDPRLNQAI